MGPPPRGRKPEGGTGPSAEDPQCTESSGVPERRGPTAISRGSRCPELATRRSVRSSTAAGPQVRELLVMIEGSLMGRVRADKAGGLSLDYESSWRESPQGHSLSVSMPLAQIPYLQKPVLSYLWNPLPENPNVLQRWGQQYHVSAANPFKLLANVGADVPGAAQFIPPERLEEIQSTQQPTVHRMTIDERGDRLRQLRADIAAVRQPGEIGNMSLPGAQAKTAYYWDKQRNRWGVPGGRTPSTHISRRRAAGLDRLRQNES